MILYYPLMNIVSWGDRSEILTKAYYLYLLMASIRQNLQITERDLAQMGEAKDFFESVIKIKQMTSPYILIENYSLSKDIPHNYSLWQRVLDSVTIEQVNDAQNTILKLEQREKVPDETLKITSNLLENVYLDLAYETPDDW